MHLSRLSLSALLLGAPCISQAQTATDSPPAPRFYVGLGAYSSFYQPLGSIPFGSTGVRLPVQLTAGYQLRPRLAVQVGLAYSGNTAQYSEQGYYYTASSRGTYYGYNATSTVRHASVSALARYTLTRNPAHRVQFDALGGFTLEHSTGYNRGTQSDSLSGALRTTSFSNHNSQNELLLTVGLGTRFRLSQRFELTYDFTFNRNLTDSYRPSALDLTSSSALGLRYRFGRR